MVTVGTTSTQLTGRCAREYNTTRALLVFLLTSFHTLLPYYLSIVNMFSGLASRLAVVHVSSTSVPSVHIGHRTRPTHNLRRHGPYALNPAEPGSPIPRKQDGKYRTEQRLAATGHETNALSCCHYYLVFVVLMPIQSLNTRSNQRLRVSHALSCCGDPRATRGTPGLLVTFTASRAAPSRCHPPKHKGDTLVCNRGQSSRCLGLTLYLTRTTHHGAHSAPSGLTASLPFFHIATQATITLHDPLAPLQPITRYAGYPPRGSTSRMGTPCPTDA